MAIDNTVDAVDSQYPERPELALELSMFAMEAAAGHAAPLLKFVGLIGKHFSGKEKQARANALLEALRVEQKFLEADFTKLKVKVEDLAESVQSAVYQDIQAFNDEKRDRYLKILGAAVRSAEKIEDLSGYIRDVEQLGEQDITVLKVLNKVTNQTGDWNESAPRSLWKVHPNAFIQRRQELAVQIAQAFGMKTDLDSNQGQTFSHEEGYSVCARLQGFGLAHEVQLSAREVPIGDYCFRPSKRGLMLLKLLGEEVPNWEYYFRKDQT